MVAYYFSFKTALVKGSPNAVAANATVLIYDVTDVNRTTPVQAFTDPGLTTIANLVTDQYGIVPDFYTDARPDILWKSGTFKGQWATSQSRPGLRGPSGGPGATGPAGPQGIPGLNGAGTNSDVAAFIPLAGPTRDALDARFLQSGNPVPEANIPERLGEAALNATYATASRAKYTALNDRSVFSPGGALTFAWNFLPLPEPGTHYGQCILRETDGKYRLYSIYSRANLGIIHLAEPIFGIPGDSVYDSNLLVLPNGKFVMACHSGDQGSIHFFTSTDKGSTWTAGTVVDPGDPYVTHRRFSEVHMIRVQLGSPYTGTSYRIIAAWCDIDPVFPVSRDTQYVTAFSDDEGVTWSAPVIVTPTSGTGSAGIVNDNTRPWLYQGVDGKINLLYSRAVEASGKAYGSIMHTQLSGDGATVVTAPVKVTDCPYSVGNMSRPDHPGAGPAVFEGRDGKFHLVWSESNYADAGTDGVINIMEGAGGPADWTGKTKLIHRQDAPNGFGRVQPTRVGDSVEVIYGFVNTPTSTQMRSLTLSGL